MIKFGIRELLFLAVLIAMPAASYWLVFKPQNREITEAKQEIEHKQLMLEKLDEATSQADDLEEQNAQIEASISLVESRLPGNKEVDVVLEQVAEIARKQKLTLKRVKRADPVPNAGYMEQPLEMDIEGDFDDFYVFLLEVEKLERITRMFELSIEGDDQNEGAMTAEFTLSIYFENPKPTTIAEVSE
ncbi:MAG: type 4a pilus biogenesis protein PilO [Planctomycetota bacterium]